MSSAAGTTTIPSALDSTDMSSLAAPPPPPLPPQRRTISRHSSAAGSNGTNSRRGSDVPMTLDYLWPYAKEQNERLYAVVERLSKQRKLLEDCVDFFKVIETIEATAARDYRKALKIFGVVDPPKGPTFDPNVVGQGVGDLFVGVTVISDQHLSIAKAVRDTIIKHLDTIASTSNRSFKELRSEIEKECQNVQKSRNETLSAIATHLKAYQLVNVRHGSSGDLVDPWLTEKALHIQLQEMVAKENRFQDRILILVEQGRQAEQQCLGSLKAVLNEFLELKRDATSQLRDQVIRLQQLVVAYDQSEPFTIFARDVAQVPSPLWTTTHAASEFGERINVPHVTGVVRQGVLHRLGTIRKSTWKPSWFVLTEAGFLHCFEDKSVPFDPCLDADVAKGGRPTSAAAAVRASKVLFSVCLRQARTSVQYLADRAFEYCFEITVQPPRETGLFAFGKNKETKYLIKASTEEDMVDWLCAIKKQIELYTPKSPPEPLFPAPTAVQDRVDDHVAATAAAVAAGASGADAEPGASPAAPTKAEDGMGTKSLPRAASGRGSKDALDHPLPPLPASPEEPELAPTGAGV
ncbi:hypothetical protein GGF32_004305 [Allomyces javanicus]|nr:hypothetical protein GGF32_004305 [Allomyces javanicus]